MTLINFKMWFILGFTTLAVARTAALLERDAKKVVALSTLSQLGLMFVSLSIGNIFLCLFHVLTHALAKSNLFIVVGSSLHRRFAQQDSRSLNDITIMFLSLSAIVRISSLAGLVFISGFFSKEQILAKHYLLIPRVLSLVALFVISRFTLSYCVKLILVTAAASLSTPC